MNVRVRLFAAVRQAAACDCMEVSLPDGATIAELRRSVAQQVPELSRLIERATFAVDAEYAADTAEIPSEADVACIPPVSGG